MIRWCQHKAEERFSQALLTGRPVVYIWFHVASGWFWRTGVELRYKVLWPDVRQIQWLTFATGCKFDWVEPNLYSRTHNLYYTLYCCITSYLYVSIQFLNAYFLPHQPPNKLLSHPLGLGVFILIISSSHDFAS